MLLAIPALISALTTLGIVVFVATHLQTVIQDFGELGKTFGTDWIAPAIKPVVDASLFFFMATTGGVLGVYFLEKGIATRTGEHVALPGIPNIQAPAQPTFGASSGYSIAGGPVTVGVGQQFGHAPRAPVPTPQPVRLGSGGVTAGFRAARSGAGRAPAGRAARTVATRPSATPTVSRAARRGSGSFRRAA